MVIEKIQKIGFCYFKVIADDQLTFDHRPSQFSNLIMKTQCNIFGLIICIPLTNKASPILRFQAGSAITMECICVHKYIYIFYR